MNIAINGFGRIGRLFLRQAFAEPFFSFRAINDLGDGQNLAYLLKHDSVYRTWPRNVSFSPGSLTIDSLHIPFISEREPASLPWKELGVDVVIEATGVFDSYERAKVHLDRGAKHVVITAPARDLDGELGRTVLMGVNESDVLRCAITSNGSCTTNSVSSVISILHEAIGVERSVLSTVHAFTATQSVVDSAVKGDDYRRGRAASENIAPSTTGAALAVTRAIPSLVSKFDGLAFRVPVAAGSISDITFVASRPTSTQEINKVLIEAEQSSRFRGILRTTEEQLVSSDIIGEPYGAIVDLRFTKVVDNTLCKVLAWYDNEWGYVSTLIRHVKLLIEKFS